MSRKLPQVSGKELVKALEKPGFVVKRVTGSHHVMFNPETKRIVPVPYHETVSKGVLLDAIKQSGLTREDSLALL